MPKELLNTIVDIWSVIFCEDSERPGESEEWGKPKDIVGQIPGVTLWITQYHDILLQVNVFQVHALPGFHVVIKALIVSEKAGSLCQVGILRLNVGKTKALGEPHLCQSRLL